MSPGVYMQTCAIIEHLIQQNNDIRGISLGGLEHILSQFADDTCAFLQFTPLAIDGFCCVLRTLENQLGLKVSYDKTALYRVGSLANSNAQCYTQFPLKWTNDNVKTLGIEFTSKGESSAEGKDKIFCKVKSTLNNWSNHHATLAGKVLIVNALIASLFVYHMSVMLNFSDEELLNIDKEIHKFLWNGKSRGRVAMTTLKRSRADGGLKLVDLKSKQMALKIQNVFKLENSILQYMYELFNIKDLGEIVWECNISPKDVKLLFQEQNFWSEALEGWSTINFYRPQSKAEVLKQILWLNSEIRINNYPVLWSKWIHQNIWTIEDIVVPGGTEFKPWADTAFNGANWLDYVSLTNAIPPVWKCFLKDEVMGQDNTQLYTEVFQSPKISQLLYSKFVAGDSDLVKYANRWITGALPNLDREEYSKNFVSLLKVTKSTKLRDFQYRLLLGKLVFNDDLYKWGKRNSNECTFCGKHCESFQHIFVECEFTSNIWKAIKEMCDQFNIEAIIDINSVFMNSINSVTTHIINYICLIIKQYVYRCRCTDNKPVMWSEEIDRIHDYELFESRNNGQLNRHCKRWMPIKPELRRLMTETNSFTTQYLSNIEI